MYQRLFGLGVLIGLDPETPGRGWIQFHQDDDAFMVYSSWRPDRSPEPGSTIVFAGQLTLAADRTPLLILDEWHGTGIRWPQHPVQLSLPPRFAGVFQLVWSTVKDGANDL